MPSEYLVGMKSDVKSWSERHGQMDTPLEHFKIDEIGNVLLEKSKTGVNKRAHTLVIARAKEWIQISNDTDQPISRAILKKHPSLAEAHILLNIWGNVLERRLTVSPRLSKSVPFLVPRFPAHRVRRGKSWDETVKWLDEFSDWQIAWTGTFHWTIGHQEPCQDNTCTKLTYTAELEPVMKSAPAWAKGTVHDAHATASGSGQAFFDLLHERLVNNIFSYDGLLRVPIRNLERIPLELRVGNIVRGPGEIVIRFENKISIQKS